MPENSTPVVDTVEEFLTSTKISRTTFYKMVKLGQIRVVKFGRATRVPRSERERLLSAPIKEAA